MIPIDNKSPMRLNRRMRPFIVFLTSALALAAPAQAMVGNAPLATVEAGSRHAVMIVGSRGNACTGTAIARDLVLTAAHCVPAGADYKIVEFDAARRVTFRDVQEIARHPQFSLLAMQAARATADIAVLKLSAPLSETIIPAALSASDQPARPGEMFTIIGYGVTSRQDARSGGTLRSARLIATGSPGGLQIRLVDPSTHNERPGLGACKGDSGGPAFSGGVIVGVISWSTGHRNSAGCGGLTGIAPVMRYRGWVVETARRLGSVLGR